MKEQAMALCDYKYADLTRKHFDRCYRWATHSRVPPIIKRARMRKKRLTNILTFVKLGITNAASVSLNSKFQWVT
jgi:transposase